ncbi:kinase-like domain-containing protein, partial [Hyaloscypha finlandica]
MGEHVTLGNNEWRINLEEVDILGGGQSAVVKRVKSKDAGNIYALKLIYRNTSSVEQRFGEELCVLLRVSHHNVIGIVGSFTSPGYFGLLMKPAASHNLAEYLNLVPKDRSRLSLPKFFGCLACAVEYLHYRAYITHNDIKPQNILVEKENVYLADFGSSKDWSKSLQSTTVGQRGFTPMYCSPEAAGKKEKKKPSSDIWSLGCVFLEMIT